jgi:uncharacterized RmlC-like cupin family protein
MHCILLSAYVASGEAGLWTGNRLAINDTASSGERNYQTTNATRGDGVALSTLDPSE